MCERERGGSPGLSDTVDKGARRFNPGTGYGLGGGCSVDN